MSKLLFSNDHGRSFIIQKTSHDQPQENHEPLLLLGQQTAKLQKIIKRLCQFLKKHLKILDINQLWNYQISFAANTKTWYRYWLCLCFSILMCSEGFDTSRKSVNLSASSIWRWFQKISNHQWGRDLMIIKMKNIVITIFYDITSVLFFNHLLNTY